MNSETVARSAFKPVWINRFLKVKETGVSNDLGLNWFADSLGDFLEDWFAFNDSFNVATLNWNSVFNLDWVVDTVLFGHFSALVLDGGGHGSGDGSGHWSNNVSWSMMIAKELGVSIGFGFTLGQEVWSNAAVLGHDVLADALVLYALGLELLGVAHPVVDGGTLGRLNLIVLNHAVGWKSWKSGSGKSHCSDGSWMEQLRISLGSGQSHSSQARSSEKLEHGAKVGWNGTTHFPR